MISQSQSNSNGYRLVLDVEPDLEETKQLTIEQALYYLSRLLQNGHKLKIYYNGSGDDGDIEETLLDDKHISVLTLNTERNVFRVHAKNIGYELIDYVSEHSGVYISFDNEGCSGKLVVTENEGCLIVDCEHAYGASEVCIDYEKQEKLRLDHSVLRLYKDLNSGEKVYPTNAEELCNLLWVMGVKYLDISKDKLSEEPFIHSLSADNNNEKMEKQATELVVNYLDKRSDGFSLVEAHRKSESTQVDRLFGCEFFLKYEVIEDDEYLLDLQGYIEEGPSEEISDRLTIEFNMQRQMRQTKRGANDNSLWIV